MSIPLSPRGLRLVAVAAAVLTAAGIAVALPAGTASATTTKTWRVDEPVCAQPADVTAFRCFAERSVAVARGTAGAHPAASVGHGPAGGYTPSDLAKAYNYNPAAATKQTVAVVDWYDDPYALADLNIFDRTYHLPAETSASFRKVNQSGSTSHLPRADADMSGEITLDIETVRGVCNHCKIILVEATEPSNADLAAAENTAVRLGANEVSNSWGGAEGGENATLAAAFKHPGVVITAATGDDGWYGWDQVNGNADSDNAASFPSTSPYVVSVGGTTLTVNSDGTRKAETVWNTDGASDSDGYAQSSPLGASGGGCSHSYAAPLWQVHTSGYAALGCAGSRRSAADIAALADPAYGFDVYDRYGTPLYSSACSTQHPNLRCWGTAGGTSLSSPVIAAMYALLGGSGGSAWPAASLYVNVARASGLRYDVTAGGNSFCGGAATTDCSAAATYLSGTTNNPNQLAPGNSLDCSFPHAAQLVDATRLPKLPQCNATAGLDGPSGLGTPHGLRMFINTAPQANFAVPSTVPHGATRAYTASVYDIRGAQINAIAWAWGDGQVTGGTARAARATHKYARAGTYRITFAARDTYGQVIYRYRTVRAT